MLGEDSYLRDEDAVVDSRSSKSRKLQIQDSLELHLKLFEEQNKGLGEKVRNPLGIEDRKQSAMYFGEYQLPSHMPSKMSWRDVGAHSVLVR